MNLQIPNSNASGPGPGMMNPQMMMAQQRMPMGNPGMGPGPMMRSGQIDPSMSGPGGPNGPMMGGPGPPQHMRPQMTSQMMMQMQSQQHQMQMGNRPPPPDYGKIMPHQVSNKFEA